MKYGLLLTLCIMYLTNLNAQTQVTGRITYVTSTTAYVDLGTNHGLDVGDTILVTRGGKSIATMKVATIASKSLSAVVLTKQTSLLEGDDVTAVTVRTPKEPVRLIRPDTGSTALPPTVSVPPTATPPLETAASNIVHGRIGVQYFGMYNDAKNTLDFSQPGLVLNFTVDRIMDAPLQFSYYSNSRYDAVQQARSASDSRLNNRVYEAVFRYGDDHTPLNGFLGRFVAPAVGGVGTFDGAMGTYRYDQFQCGAAAGSQPGWQRSDVQLTNPKFAAFATYEAGEYGTTKYQGGVAYAQQYYQSALDRGFFYLQNTLYFSNSLSIYQNANFDMHDLVDGKRMTSLHLSDVFLSASYRPMNWVSTNASYARRRNIFYLSSFSNMPDSLFDISVQQNLQASVSFRLPMTMYLTTTGSMRSREGDARSATSLFVNYNWSDILGTHFGAFITGLYNDNVYNTSRSIGVDLHTDIIEDLYLSAKAQWYVYDFSSFTRRIYRTTVGADAYYRVSRIVYASLSLERYIETTLTSNRIYGEVTIRF